MVKAERILPSKTKNFLFTRYYLKQLVAALENQQALQRFFEDQSKSCR